jgi:hypothetical protein
MATQEELQELLDTQEAKLKVCIGDECQKIRDEFLKNRPPGVSLEQIQGMLDRQLTSLKPKPHTFGDHETADTLLDCPECRERFEQTGKRWKVTIPKEPIEPTEKKEEKSKEPTFEFGGIRPRETE